jgi:hypothetical protein
MSLYLPILIVGLLGGLARADDEPTRTYRYAVPEKTDDGWETTSLAEAGLDPALIQELFERIGDETYKNTSTRTSGASTGAVRNRSSRATRCTRSSL